MTPNQSGVQTPLSVSLHVDLLSYPAWCGTCGAVVEHLHGNCLTCTSVKESQAA